MKHTKKLISIVLAGAILMTVGITAFAEPITQTTDPEGTATVTYTVDPLYTVVIPNSVTLGEDEVEEQILIYGSDKNSNVVIPSSKVVNVALTESANGFNVLNADNDAISYTVNGVNDLSELTDIAWCYPDSKTTTDIIFEKTGAVVFSGTYTDTLTFTVSLEDA